MRTYRKFKIIDNYKCDGYLHQVTNTHSRILNCNKIAINQSETRHRNRPILTLYRPYIIRKDHETLFKDIHQALSNTQIPDTAGTRQLNNHDPLTNEN